MAETWITPHIIAREALIVLENETILKNLIHQGFSTEFQKVGATVSIRKPATFTAASVSDTVNMATATEASVDIVLNQHIDITQNVTSKDMSLSIVDFSEQVIVPTMRAHADYVDGKIAGLYSDIAAHYRVSSTPALGDIAELRGVLGLNKVPMQDRRLVFHPVSEAGYIKLDAFNNAHKRGDGGRAMREAEMGRVLGFDCYMDQNIKTHDSGLEGVDSTGALKGDGASAATLATVDAILTSGTVLPGDIFKVTGYDDWHVVGAACTANQATIILNFSPAFKVANADNAVVTILQTHRANLAFHKNAFAIATAPLAPPIGGAAAAVVNYRNVSARVVYDYTMMTKKNLISVDLLFGIKTLDRELAGRLADEN